MKTWGVGPRLHSPFLIKQIMAQKKTVAKASEQEVIKKEEEKVEAPVKVEKPEAISEKTVEIEEIPDYAKKILKLYDSEPELYISKKGGVFSVNTEPSLRGSAILFKNPYYKS